MRANKWEKRDSCAFEFSFEMISERERVEFHLVLKLYFLKLFFRPTNSTLSGTPYQLNPRS